MQFNLFLTQPTQSRKKASPVQANRSVALDGGHATIAGSTDVPASAVLRHAGAGGKHHHADGALVVDGHAARGGGAETRRAFRGA